MCHRSFWVYSHCKHGCCSSNFEVYQCPVNTTVGTKSTGTVVVAAKADGVQLTSSRVINEIVLDGGAHFSPAG